MTTAGSPSPQVLAAPRRGIGQAWRAARWYLAEFFGDNAYDKYLARHALAHGDETAPPPPLTRREFYRRRTDGTPARGCC